MLLFRNTRTSLATMSGAVNPSKGGCGSPEALAGRLSDEDPGEDDRRAGELDG